MNEKLISKNPWLTCFSKIQDVQNSILHGKKKTFLVFIKWEVEKLKLDLKGIQTFREERS